MEKLDEAQAKEVNEWLERLVVAQRQADHEVRRDARPGDQAPNESGPSYIEQREQTRERPEFGTGEASSY